MNRSISNTPHSSGIYKITNTVNGHTYIGQSKDLRNRATEHFYFLLRGNHHNCYLQNAYDKYGSESFTFCVLETRVRYVDLNDREQYFIELLHPVYNIIRNVFEGVGCSLVDKATHDIQAVFSETDIKPFGWVEASRPAWHRIVYGCGTV